MELNVALTGLGSFALAWSLAFAAHALRYTASSALVGAAVQWVPALGRRRLAARDARNESRAPRAFELVSSLETGAVFGVVASAITLSYRAGYTQLYLAWGAHEPWYPAVSLAALFVLHDTYFYWTHRVMHHQRWFGLVHAHHHRSSRPTAWSAYSFTLSESFIQAGFYGLVVFVLPLHFSVLALFVVSVNVHAAMIHSGHDVFFARGRVGLRTHGNVLNTAVQHDMHHGGAKGNYGLYFTFWDRCMGTYMSDGPLVEGGEA